VNKRNNLGYAQNINTLVGLGGQIATGTAKQNRCEPETAFRCSIEPGTGTVIHCSFFAVPSISPFIILATRTFFYSFIILTT